MCTLKPALQSRNGAYTNCASRKGDGKSCKEQLVPGESGRGKEQWVPGESGRGKEQLVPGESGRGREGMFLRKESLKMHQGYIEWILRVVAIKGCSDPLILSFVAAMLHSNAGGDTSPLF